MKKIIKINESDLTKIIKRVITEMEDTNEKLSVHDWEDIWFKLRRLSQSFLFPDANNYYFTFGGLDFNYNEDDGSLILHPMLADPYMWRNEYEDGVEVLEKYANKISRFIEDSGLDIELEMGPNFQMKISKV